MKITKADIVKALQTEPLWPGKWFDAEYKSGYICNVCAVGAVLRGVCGVRPRSVNNFFTADGRTGRVIDERYDGVVELTPIDRSMPYSYMNFIDGDSHLSLPSDIPWMNYLSIAFEKACVDLYLVIESSASNRALKLQAIRLEMIDLVLEEFPETIEVQGV